MQVAPPSGPLKRMETRRAALDDLLLGRGVRRGRHEIPLPLASLVRERLAACRFVETRVADVPVEVGVRVPAWLFRPPILDFGVVFWEVFTDTKRRKLFGSEVRNRKGDWEIQLAASSPETLWAGLEFAESYDASRPLGMW
jgi:hypothetical protein